MNKQQKPVSNLRKIKAREPTVNLEVLLKHSKDYYQWLLRSEKDVIKIKSNICGYGIVAAQVIKEGEEILEYWGTRIDPDVIERSCKPNWENERHFQYLMATINRSVYVNADRPECMARYANNSCDANAELETVVLKGKNGIDYEIVVLKAKRDIWLFEEITTPYSWEIRKKDTIIICSCPAKQCKGFIGKIMGFQSDKKVKMEMQVKKPEVVKEKVVRQVTGNVDQGVDVDPEAGQHGIILEGNESQDSLSFDDEV